SPRESFHRFRDPLVALAKSLHRSRSAGSQDGAAELVDSQLVRSIDELPIGLGPVAPAVMIQVRMRIDNLAQARQAGPKVLAGLDLRRGNETRNSQGCWRMEKRAT